MRSRIGTAVAITAAVLVGAVCAPRAGDGPTAEAAAPAVQPGQAGLVALTFDDGPTPMTADVLDILREKDVRATFFVQGQHASRHPGTLRRMQRDGHVIGNHSWSHPNFQRLSTREALWQIDRTNSAVRDATGLTPTLFRYPHGDESATGNEAIRRRGMWGGVLWHWQSGVGDYSCPGAGQVHDYLLQNATNQALLLLHDGNETMACGSDQLAYLPQAIDELRAQGYEFGVVVPAEGPSPVNQQSWVKVVPSDGAR